MTQAYFVGDETQWSGVTFAPQLFSQTPTYFPFSQLPKSDVRLDSHDASSSPSYIADEEWR
jgi:hypothetical protein